MIGLPIRFSRTAAAAKPPRVGRPANPAVWLDRELAHQLLEVIAAPSGNRPSARAVRAWLRIEREAFGDIALGEHLAAGLDERERRVAVLRTLQGECRERTALALEIDVELVTDVEHSACLKAATLTHRYHDNLICEPADLAVAVGHSQREAVVARHLSRCGRCGPEFAARAANVLHHCARFIAEREPEAVLALAGR